MIGACKEVGPALFFSLLIITVSFLPVFTLEARKVGCSRRWPTPRPSAMAGAAILSVTLVPGADDAVHPRAIMPRRTR